MTKKYTLDQIVEGQYVFLERPDETVQLVIEKEKIKGELSEGDIVSIYEVGNEYLVEVLEEETKITLNKVNELLEKLKRKNI